MRSRIVVVVVVLFALAALSAVVWRSAGPDVIVVAPPTEPHDPLQTPAEVDQRRADRSAHDLSAHDRSAPGPILRGVVLENESGEPLPNVTVVFLGVGDAAAATRPEPSPTKTDASGRFKVVGWPDTTIAAVVIWDGCVLPDGGDATSELSDLSPPQIRLGDMGDDVEHTIRVQRPRRLRGRVVDESGALVSGAAVSWRPVSGSASVEYFVAAGFTDFPPPWSSDRRGRFDVALPPTVESVIAVAEAEGRVKSWSHVVEVGANGSFPEVDIELRPAGVIEGRVTDPSGRPAAAVDVWWYEADTPFTDRPRGVTTDAQGAFRLRYVSPSRVTVRAARGRGRERMSTVPREVTVQPAQTTTIEIQLREDPVYATPK